MLVHRKQIALILVFAFIFIICGLCTTLYNMQKTFLGVEPDFFTMGITGYHFIKDYFVKMLNIKWDEIWGEITNRITYEKA